MTPTPYCAMIRSKNHRFDLRLCMVKYALGHGIRAAAQAFASSRNSVRLWLRRYQKEGKAGLTDRSRAPHHCPHKTSPAREKKIIEARERLPCAGPRRLRDLFGLKASTGAIARIVRQAGLTRKRRTKREKKNDLRAIKARHKPFERLQADTKPLYDIPFYWPQMTDHRLPRQQYTVRDVKSGALFIDFADELSTTHATASAQRLLAHLKRHDVAMKTLELSTDNGSEYGGTERYERQRGFHARVQNLGATHRFLPPATPNAHSDVESSHALIEQELFDLENFSSRKDFMRKVTLYQRWFNFGRPNYSKGGKTPAQILTEEGFDPRILLLEPLDLEQYLRNLNLAPYARPRVGQDLPALPGS